MYYVETKSTVPYYNLAFEEYVLTHCMEGDIMMLWQNDNTIVVGQNQNTEAEIDRKYVEEKRICVVRRNTGGGAVYHDMGNLNYSFITDVDDIERMSLKHFMTPVVKALRALGLDAEINGRNDILVNGKKVSGTAQRLYKNRILHHGTLLFDSDLTVVAKALRAAPEKFRSKSAKSVQSRVGNIRECLKEDMTMKMFWEYLKTALSETGVIEISLGEAALSEIKELKEKKYDTWEWNFGKTSEFSRKNRKYFQDKGVLEVLFHAEEGRIKDIRFMGDFLSRRDTREIQEALIGQRYEKNEVSSVLQRFPLTDYFGGIAIEEVLDVMFY